MNFRIVTALLLTCALLIASNRASAADPDQPTVSAVGMGTVEKRPDLMRMTTQLQMEGPTLKDALAKLQARRDQIKDSLAKLGAVEGSIDLGEPAAIDANSQDRRGAMERMIRQRMNGNKPAATAPAAKSVTVSVTIKADFPLKAGTTEETLISAAELQDKIKAAKLFDVPKSAAKAEEDEEAASGDSFPGQGDQGPKPGEPVFFYVAKISPAEQGKAQADAFAKAKAAAEQLAKAAGAAIGNLRSLNSQSNDADPSTYYGDYSGGQSYAQRYLYQLAQQNAAGASGSMEAYSPQPGKITHQVFVSATFTIK